MKCPRCGKENYAPYTKCIRCGVQQISKPKVERAMSRWGIALMIGIFVAACLVGMQAIILMSSDDVISHNSGIVLFETAFGLLVLGLVIRAVSGMQRGSSAKDASRERRRHQ